GMLLSMMIWFLCYCEVMSSDKFLALFGNVAPTISLLISMILRYIPDTMRRGEEIRTAQAAMLGGETLSRREKTAQGIRMASILMSWSMESSIETADSMRARGYGTARRTSAVYQPLCATDIILLCLLLAMTAAMCAILLLPRFKFEFYPVMSPMHISAAWCIYPALLLIPLILEAKEVVSCRLYR
ncbi:MAG: hypothetical protein IJP17_06895, partial [Clostridia bacterium]|nr:hypothetical protein [Clostridia bacterium]